MKIQKYSRKEHLEEYVFSIRRALHFSGKLSNYAYPPELAQFEIQLQELVKQADELEIKYFEKQWQQEEEEE